MGNDVEKDAFEAYNYFYKSGLSAIYDII